MIDKNNIQSKDVLEELNKDMIKAFGPLLKLDDPNRNMTIFSQKAIDITNKYLSSLEQPIMVETEYGVCPLLNPRAESFFCNSRNNLIGIDICGNIPAQNIIMEFKLDDTK